MSFRSLLFMLPLVGVLLGLPGANAEDDDDRDERAADRHQKGEHQERSARGRERKDEERSDKSAALLTAINPVYTDTCAACHFAYPPALLPARSWQKVLTAMPDHFGESVDLDVKDKAEIANYLQANAADHSQARRAARIMRSVGGTTPARITEIPYIRAKHDELASGVLKRKSIGSLSNCNACHQHAAQGVFEEDDVRIPPA